MRVKLVSTITRGDLGLAVAIGAYGLLMLLLLVGS